MSKATKLALRGQLAASLDNASAATHPITGWMPADNVAKLAFDIEIRGKNGNFTAALGYQVADTENSPDAAVAVTSYATSDGFTYHTAWTSVSATTEGKQLIRFVILAKLSSGSTLATGWVGGNAFVVAP